MKNTTLDNNEFALQYLTILKPRNIPLGKKIIYNAAFGKIVDFDKIHNHEIVMTINLLIRDKSEYWVEKVSSGYKLWYKGVLYREYMNQDNHIMCYFEKDNLKLNPDEIIILCQ